MTSPISASSLNNYVSFSAKPKDPVVCPPAQFYKYSVYDDLDLGKDRYKEFIRALSEDSAGINPKKEKSTVLKVFGYAVFAALCALAYAERGSVGKFFGKVSKYIKEAFAK